MCRIVRSELPSSQWCACHCIGHSGKKSLLSHSRSARTLLRLQTGRDIGEGVETREGVENGENENREKECRATYMRRHRTTPSMSCTRHLCGDKCGKTTYADLAKCSSLTTIGSRVPRYGQVLSASAEDKQGTIDSMQGRRITLAAARAIFALTSHASPAAQQLAAQSHQWW